MAPSHLRLALTPEARSFLEEWEGPLPYVVAHTSGSTGTPKEIRLLKSDMLASARATAEFFQISSASTLFLPLSPSYIAGKMQIVRALAAECQLICEAPSNRPFKNPPTLSNGSKLIAIVPSQIEGLLESPLFNELTHIIIGGAPIPPHFESLLTSLCAPAWATYGMTETCSHVALRRIGTASFKALPGFTFSTDTRGCLIISSQTLSTTPITTNDIVTLLSPTEMIFRGRADNVINSGGIKIHPEELERLIVPLLPPGYKAYITGRKSERWGEEAVVVTDWPALSINSVTKALSGHHDYLLPKAIIILPEIPLTSSGKIIRQRL